MAKALITSNYDLLAVARSAGSLSIPVYEPTVADGAVGYLIVNDVPQSALDAAIADFDVTAYQQTQAAELSRKAAIKTDALRTDLLNRLKSATPAQISNYVDNSVTDLASARVMFKRVLLLISLGTW